MPLNIVAIRHYYEQPRIIDQHHNYHKRMTQNREEKCPVVYLDRRWPMHMIEKARNGWEKTVTGGTIGGTKHPSSSGQRLIILHAGCVDGWVPNCALVFNF